MRRLAIVAHYDPDGRLGAHVEHLVDSLRSWCERIVVVVNGELTAADTSRAAAVFDDVTFRPNAGFDVEAYRRGFDDHRDLAVQMDEVVFLNTTVYGPVRPLEPMFERMDSLDVDFWGVVAHPAVAPSPLDGSAVMPEHLQSFWLAVRAPMLRSDDWSEYWDGMPPIRTYLDAVLHNETRFTDFFASRGYRWRAAYELPESDVQNATIEAADVLFDIGCPFVKRRLFFHEPLHFDMHAVHGRDMLDRLETSGYPMHVLWDDVNRMAQPRVVQTNMSMMEVLPSVDLGGTDPATLRVGVLAHVFYVDMLDEILDRCAFLPGGFRLIATTTTEEKRVAIEQALEERGRLGDDVRVVDSNRGRDISAFLIGCADVLLGDEFDLVVKLHTKRSPTAGFNRARSFQRHLFENLLESPGYVANLVRLFADTPTLGMVFPPMIHVGYPTLGRAWLHNREPAQALAERVGIHVPFDHASPVAAYGSMFVARPAALRPLVEGGLRWDEFPDEGGYRDGTLAHVIERLFAYAALSEGFEVRLVATTRNAADSHVSLEYKLQAVLDTLPGALHEQVAFARGLGAPGGGAAEIADARAALSAIVRRHPRATKAAARALRAAMQVRARLRRR